MFAEPLVSIIVPVYNAAEHLESCIKSLQSQAYSRLEIILVDDGSKDSSGQLCDSFAKADQRIQVIHQENGGVARARNKGLQAACGKYLAFCDSDDRLERTFIAEMVQVAESGAMPICKLIKVSQDRVTADPDLEPADAGWCWPILRNYHISCCRCLFLREVIHKQGITFNPGRKTGEDQEFTLKYMLHMENISYVPDAVYCYRIHTSSTMFQKNYDHFQAVDAMASVAAYAEKVCAQERAEAIVDALEGYKYPSILEFAITTMLTAGVRVSSLMDYLKDRGYYALLQNAVKKPKCHNSNFMRLWKVSPRLCLAFFAARKRLGRIYRKLLKGS